MNKEKNIIPELRFPEFVDEGEWLSDTLINLAKFRRGSFPQPYGLPKWYDDINGMPFIQVYDVDDNFRLKASTKRKISELAAEQSVFIEEGTVIITIQGSIGRVAVTQYDAYIDRTLLIFQNYHIEVNKTFFAYVLFLLFEIEKEKAPGGIIKTITKEVLSTFLVKLPSIQEQNKIAACLSSLDDLIEANNQKLETLKAHKKGLMQNLFPQKGAKVPKFRFTDFINDGIWVEKSLEQICEVNPKIGELPDIFVYIDLESVSNGLLLKENIIKKEEAPSRAQRLLKNKDVIYQMVRPYQKNNYHFNSSGRLKYVASTGYAQLRAFDSSSFLFQLIHTSQFVSDVLEKCTGSNYPAINSSALKQIKVHVPPSKYEQQKIASSLSVLDELIVAQSDKIDQLKAHKKGLMQGLFPKKETGA